MPGHYTCLRSFFTKAVRSWNRKTARKAQILCSKTELEREAGEKKYGARGKRDFKKEKAKMEQQENEQQSF